MDKAEQTSSVYEAAPNELILKAAEALKANNSIKPPVWAPFVKTGTNRERLPDQLDWWYIRTAAVLRQIYLKPQGVQRLRRKYGGRKNMGFKPERFKKGSGNILRKVLQQLEKAGFVKKEKTGRIITPAGTKFLDSLSKSVPPVHVIEQQKAEKRKSEAPKFQAPTIQAKAPEQKSTQTKTPEKPAQTPQKTEQSKK